MTMVIRCVATFWLCQLMIGCTQPSMPTVGGSLPERDATQSSYGELEIIRNRYVNWVVGSGTLTRKDPLVAAHHQTMLDTFAAVEKKYDGKGGLAGLGKISFSRTKDKQPVARYVFDELLPALSMSYAYPGLMDSPNPKYHSPKLLQKIIAVLDHMHEGGWQKGVNTGFDFEVLEKTGFTGFGGSINNNISGYSKTIMLLRDELEAAGHLGRELETLDWVTRIFAPPPEGEESYHFNFPGFNSDGFKSMVRNRLTHVAAQQAGDPTRDRNMHFLQRFYDKAYTLAPGWADTIKPDGLGYHHKGFYGNSYSQEAFEAAARSIYLLRDTSYQVSQQSIDNVKLGLSTFRLYSQKYDMHRGGSGRFPDNIDHILRLLPAYAYLGGRNGLNDPEVKAMLARLWDRSYFERINVFAEKFERKGMGALGELEVMLAAEAENAQPEPAPSGHWVYPYGAMSIHRRPDWMAAVKGFSRYIWDYESSRTQNLFGANASSGVLRLYTRGNPVNALDSGFGLDGWDWRRLPGATTVHVPYRQMKDKQRNFSSEAFVGGLTAEGTNGVFAMRYENKAAKIPLTANKSIFFFDDQLVLLGSDIDGGDGKHAVETTLFQTRLTPKSSETVINGKSYDGELNRLSLPENKAAWLTDSVGNGFYLPNGANIQIHRSKQTAPDSRGKKEKSDFYASAWFDHGKRVKGGSYEYVILVAAGAEATSEFASKATDIYQVRQKNSRAHIVEHLKKGLTGYAFFEAGSGYESDLIAASDQPVLAMTRQLPGGQLVLSAANPDLALAPPKKTITAKDLRDSAKWLYHDSETPDVTLTLNGSWQAAEVEGVQLELVLVNGRAATKVTFAFKHAQSRDVKLQAVK